MSRTRFWFGGAVIEYPKFKLARNRLANCFLRVLFAMPLNDTTNGFKAYRREVIDACRPLRAAHFDLTAELPLKAITRGFTWTTIPVTYRKRKAGVSKWSLLKMGARYLATSFSIWLQARVRKVRTLNDKGQTQSSFHSQPFTLNPRLPSALPLRLRVKVLMR
jgi:dolichol-phosphate mannosyltransferase